MLSAFVAKRHFYPKRVRLQTLGYLPERAWINLSMPRRSCETQAISPNNNPTGRTKTSCLICESGSDSGPPAAKNGRFLAVENGRDTRSRTSKARLLLTHSPPLNQCQPINTKLPKLARHILRYLREHPEAQDTVEGIMVWWVSERAIKHWLPQVRRSLAALVARGYLEKRKTVDGHVFYRVNTSRPARRDSSRQ